MSVRVLIVDDQPLMRVGLRRAFESDPAITVVGEAEHGLGAVEATARLSPEVVLMDVRMPVLDGIEATRQIVASQSAARILILTTFGIDEHVVDALQAGASGFLLKDAPPEEIIAAVHAVARGEGPVDPGVTRALIERVRTPSAAARARLEALSPRELEVLALLGRALSNAEIAAALVVSDATVKTHVAAVLAKTGSRDRVQAAVLAYEAGVVRIGEVEGR